MNGFGERFRKLRRDKDITQNQIAEYLGIKGAAVGKWETYENAYPNVDTLIKIAEYFNVSTDYLLRGIQTVPVMENNIAGSVVQTNVQSSIQSGIVMNGQIFSPQALAIAKIYEKADIRSQNELLSLAFKIEDKILEKNVKS